MVHSTHARHVAHPGSAHRTHAVSGLKVGEDLLRTRADSIRPVVENHDPFGVVVDGLAGVVDDDGEIQAVVGVETDMRVSPIRSRMRY